jgi:hypothetical protein
MTGTITSVWVAQHESAYPLVFQISQDQERIQFSAELLNPAFCKTQ